MARVEPDVGISFRNTIHRLNRLRLKKLDFLLALQRGKLRAFVRPDIDCRCDIPPIFWEKYDTAHLNFPSDEPDFYLSLFDLRDAAMHDVQLLRSSIANSHQFSAGDLRFLGDFWTKTVGQNADIESRTNVAMASSLVLAEYISRGADQLDVLISQKSLDTYCDELKPQSKAGVYATSGPDRMWEAVIVLVYKNKKPPTTKQIYKCMDDALPDRDRNRKNEDGKLIYTVEWLQTRAEQIRRALSGALPDSENSTN